MKVHDVNFRLKVALVVGHGALTAEGGGRRPPDDQVDRLVSHYARNADRQERRCERCRWSRSVCRQGCGADLLRHAERCPLAGATVFDGRDAVAATLPLDDLQDRACVVPYCENFRRKGRWPLCETHYRLPDVRRRYCPRGRRATNARPGGMGSTKYEG